MLLVLTVVTALLFQPGYSHFNITRISINGKELPASTVAETVRDAGDRLVEPYGGNQFPCGAPNAVGPSNNRYAMYSYQVMTLTGKVYDTHGGGNITVLPIFAPNPTFDTSLPPVTSGFLTATAAQIPQFYPSMPGNWSLASLRLSPLVTMTKETFVTVQVRYTTNSSGSYFQCLDLRLLPESGAMGLGQGAYLGLLVAVLVVSLTF